MIILMSIVLCVAVLLYYDLFIPGSLYEHRNGTTEVKRISLFSYDGFKKSEIKRIGSRGRKNRYMKKGSAYRCSTGIIRCVETYGEYVKLSDGRIVCCVSEYEMVYEEYL